jgi:protein transport protein SEC24
MVATAARTILESLDRIPNEDSRTRISFIAVDSNLHFFFMPPGSTEAEMLVVGDLDDVFLPKPADLLVSLSEARAALDNLLSRLADMFKDNHNVGNAMSAGLQAAYKMIVSIVNFLCT